MGMKVNGTTGLTFPDTTTLASAGQASVRAWVNFNGLGTPAIRASYNVSSITDLGTGYFQVNFTTAMPDANFAVAGINPLSDSGGNVYQVYFAASTTGTVRVRTYNGLVSPASDADFVQLAIFR